MTNARKVDELRAGAVEMARLLKILSHPNRLLVACELMAGERSVGDIERRTGVRQPVLSRDLARLRMAGLVLTRRRSKQIFYRLADKRLANVIKGLCISCAIGRPAAARRANDGAADGCEIARPPRASAARRRGSI